MLRLLILLFPLILTGCAIGDGVAHVVKLVGKHSGGSSDSSADASAPAPAAAPLEAAAPPQPAPAPTEKIQVEELPPPKS